MNKKRLVSVIVPLYNTERYVDEAFDSIVNQNIGFVRYVELVVVDDGSTDSSLKIAQGLQKKYPDNVIIVQQKNSGVSAARNKGLDIASGRYIAFLDSDDKWSKNFLKDSVRFLEKHPSESIVASKIKFFDGNIGSHHNNYKFKKTRTINTESDPDNPLFHVSTCVFTNDIIGTNRFEVGLKISEDSKFLLEIIHKTKSYGVVSRTAYYYRKHSDKSSTIDGQRENRDFYLVTPKNVYLYLMNLWKDEEGNVARFMQYTILSDLVWRLNQSDARVLNEAEKAEYVSSIRKIASMLDDRTILTRHGLALEKKLFLLRMRHGDIAQSLHLEDGWFCYGEYRLLQLSSLRVVIEFMTPQSDGRIKLEGRVEPAVDELLRDIKVSTREGIFNIKPTNRLQRQVNFFGYSASNGGTYESSVMMGNHGELKFITAKQDAPLRCVTERFSGLSQLALSYSTLGGSLLRKHRRYITTKPNTFYRRLLYEVAYIVRLLFYWKLPEGIKKLKEVSNRSLETISIRRRAFELAKPFLIILESIMMLPRMVVLRIMYHLIRSIRHSDPIWIISDRGMAAGDNGEALFRYVMKQPERPTKVYFALSKKSEDFSRLNSIGPTLHYGCFKYKLMFLLADKIISSHADVEVTNPFIRQLNHFVDLFHFDFVFLQHGVTKDDVSSWLNRFEKNISQFIVTGKPEAESILTGPYYYVERNVLRSGFPRYDYLENHPKRKLIIAPTYRANLLTSNTDTVGRRSYNPSFKTSAYFKFYSDLMNDQRLTSALKRNNMVGEFYIHPNFAAQSEDFVENDVISIIKFPYDYKKAFSEGSLLVTDYSSVSFDFAYLKKPVIYAQFDRESFFTNHSYGQGYFDYERDGFGPVVYNFETVIQEITRLVENNSMMDAVYSKRVDKFFLYNDTNNSKRVYEAILASE